jgi:hypothetical protein
VLEHLTRAEELVTAHLEPGGGPCHAALVRPPSRRRLLTGIAATATPARVATNRLPSPLVIGYLASQPSLSSRLA